MRINMRRMMKMSSPTTIIAVGSERLCFQMLALEPYQWQGGWHALSSRLHILVFRLEDTGDCGSYA